MSFLSPQEPGTRPSQTVRAWRFAPTWHHRIQSPATCAAFCVKLSIRSRPSFRPAARPTACSRKAQGNRELGYCQAGYVPGMSVAWPGSYAQVLEGGMNGAATWTECVCTVAPSNDWKSATVIAIAARSERYELIRGF